MMQSSYKDWQGKAILFRNLWNLQLRGMLYGVSQSQDDQARISELQSISYLKGLQSIRPPSSQLSSKLNTWTSKHDDA